MTVAQESPRSAKAEQKRENILRIALAMFAKDGFHATDVQNVADAAGVGKGTIYRHFNTKNELFLATARYSQQQMGDFIRSEIGDDAAAHDVIKNKGVGEILRRIAMAYAGFYKQHPEAVEMMLLERAVFRESVFPTHLMHREETRADLDDVIASVANGSEFRNVDSKVITNTYGDLLFGTVVNGCLAGDTTDLLSRMESAMDLFLDGIKAR